jgi:dipeptidyl-peptidase 4
MILSLATVMHRSACSALLLLLVLPLAAQQPAAPALTVDAIFGSKQFDGAPMPDIHWLADGTAWATTRANPAGGTDIIRVDAATGGVTVLADAALFADSAGNRYKIEGFSLSDDAAKALVFHNTLRVWRLNTAGVYHVVDFAAKKVTPLSRAPGLQMFAKLSPNGAEAAFVRANDLFVVDLATWAERAITHDGSDVIINGTSDWVYEEELGLRDAFRWSPDSKRIAFYRFDQSPEPVYPILDQSAVHAKAMLIRYPQPGDPNARVRVGVAEIASGHTVWMQVESDSVYIAAMEWAGADSLAIQRLGRLQNRIDLVMASAATGVTRLMLVEHDSAWVDVDHGAPYWIAGGKMFLWASERSGWRRYYLFDRSGEMVRALTPDGSDAESVAGIAGKTGEIFIAEAASGPLERQVFSYALTRKPERVRITTEPGTHAVTVSPGGRLFVDIASSAGVPRAATLRELSSLAAKRVLEGNVALRADLARLTRPPEFFQIPMPDGVKLNAYRIVSPQFDSTRPHPVVIYVYGGPGSQTVANSFGGARELWHQMLAKKGYVVVSVDNRGTGARGSAFKHAVYQKLGQLESRDQIDAAKWIAQRPWADPARIAMWGWSGGGYMTALTTSRGGAVFKSGIVVAPVIDWRLYDDIYTERYMRTPAQNPEGYKDGSVLTYASGLTARLLLVHGTSDDNVHPQNTFWLANALQARNAQFEMMLYPGRTHSISGGDTQVHLFTMMTDFLDRTLGMDSAAAAK